MRRGLIVYVDTAGLDSAEAIAVAARERSIDTALICPPDTWRSASSSLWRIVETGDFSADGLRSELKVLESTRDIVGIHSSFGPVRAEGFVHEAVATLAAERGLSHSPADALLCATNKYLARTRLADAGMRDVPFGLAVDEASLLSTTRSIGYPIVLKPLTGVGSSMILRCRDDSEALERFRAALRDLPAAYYGQLRMAAHDCRLPDGRWLRLDPTRAMLVERYIAGREASVECMAVGDEVYPLVVHDKILVEEEQRIVYEHLLITPPERFTEREVSELTSHALFAVRAMGLRNMFCHVELRYEDTGGPRLLEVNPRIGAGCVADSLETFTELNVGASRVALILGEVPEGIRMRSANRHAMAFLFSPRTGQLEEFSGLRRVLKLPEVRAVRVGYGLGDRVGGDLEEVFLASVWMEAADGNAARASYEKIRDLVHVRVA